MNITTRTAARRGCVAALVAFVGFVGLPMVASLDGAGADFGAGQSARYNKNVNGDFLLVGGAFR